MDGQESQQKFQQADALYKQGRYPEALQLLDELNRVFPNTKNVLYPAALCLAKLGRKDDALNLCEQLIQQFGDERAGVLKSSLTAAPVPPPIPGLDGIDDLLDYKPRTATAPVAVKGSSDWRRYALIGAGGLALLLLIGVPLLLHEGDGGNAAERAGSVGGGEMSLGRLLVLYFFVNVVCSIPAMYAILSIMRKLRHESVTDNLLDVAMYAVILNLLMYIPLIGWIAALVIVSKHYEMSCGELLIFVCLDIAFSFGFGVVLGIVLTMMGYGGFLQPA